MYVMKEPVRQASDRHHRRWMNYLRGNGPGDPRLVVTPAQSRRIRHKLGHIAALDRREA